MLAISESYIVGVDISNQDEVPVLTVTRYNGSVVELINVITGYKAQELYQTLIKKNREEHKDENIKCD